MTAIGPRVVVVGIGGSGKTTVARELARRLNAPHVQLDELFHGPGWTSRPDDVFLPSIAEATAGDRWVVDGNYSRTRPLFWPRATDLVWLDYRRGLATWRVARRTAVGLVRRTEMYNRNREQLRNLLDPGHPVWWSWTHHAADRAEYEAVVNEPQWAHLTKTRLRSPQETERWLRDLTVA